MKLKMLCKKCNTIFTFKKKNKTYRTKHKKWIWYHYLKCPICSYENVTHYMEFNPIKDKEDFIMINNELRYIKDKG